jgi:hypothetical protein
VQRKADGGIRIVCDTNSAILRISVPCAYFYKYRICESYETGDMSFRTVPFTGCVRNITWRRIEMRSRKQVLTCIALAIAAVSCIWILSESQDDDPHEDTQLSASDASYTVTLSLNMPVAGVQFTIQSGDIERTGTLSDDRLFGDLLERSRRSRV